MIGSLAAISPRQSFYVGVKALIRDNAGRILILQDTVTGLWEIPGGRIDQSENIVDALRREISEELPGCSLAKLGEVVHVAQSERIIEDQHRLLLIFYKSHVRLAATIVLSTEHQSIAWASAQSIDAFNMYANDKEAANKLFKQCDSMEC